MKLLFTAAFIFSFLISSAQSKPDSIKNLGEVWVTEKVKTFYIDSNVKSVLLMDTKKPKILNNFIYTSGKIRYRIILYANGVYTKTRIN